MWGIVFLDEHLSPGMWVGAGLVILGVALTTGILNRKQLATV